MRKILITGGAGFIGFHLTKHILEKYSDFLVVSVDNLNAYYDTDLKKNRLKQLEAISTDRWVFKKIDIVDKKAMGHLFEEYDFSIVIHLAAQAGVGYARKSPETYIDANIYGFFNTIQLAAQKGVERFLYASSSSVYGASQKLPFNEADRTSSPMSLYAATKLSNELLASSYYYTHNFRTIGLRFFNVYGPWGRPDAAYYKWSEELTNGGPIELRDRGEMYRDMTYIGDLVRVVSALAFNYDWQKITHEIFNIGNTDPVKIVDVLAYLQQKLGVESANIIYTQRGAEESVKTFADTTKLRSAIGFAPNTNYKVGLDDFISWYKEYKKHDRVLS